MTAPTGWAVWHGWLGCGEHKKLGPYLSKCPGTRFASPSEPPSAADGARGRVCTTLKSTESPACGSLGPWHTLGSQSYHIHGWEASWTTLVYTTHTLGSPPQGYSLAPVLAPPTNSFLPPTKSKSCRQRICPKAPTCPCPSTHTTEILRSASGLIAQDQVALWPQAGRGPQAYNDIEHCACDRLI